MSDRRFVPACFSFLPGATQALIASITRPRRPCRWLEVLVFLIALLLSAGLPQQSFPVLLAADESSEDAAQTEAAKRFLTVLEKNPRRGTALDRVYGHHVEFGTLDQFLKDLKARTTANPTDGKLWMLLGLFESQRGQDGNAADAFHQAETLMTSDALASYYLGQAQLRIGQSDEAVAAFERAIARKPNRNDLLEIFQQLGRVHQRAQRTEQALQVWKRLEELFPNDPRVLEQIAVTLAEDGNPAEALPRYERLAELVKDDYRRTMCLIEVAELRIRIGAKDDGISALEKILSELDPDSWLYRDVRRRIDDVFLRTGDQDSLVRYYEQWIKQHPEDVDGMARLARFLASSARMPEAIQWMENALRRAPSRTDLRKSFIDQLVENQRIPEALVQYSQLVAAAPGNFDFLRDWGKLALRDKSQDVAIRQQEATRIWSLIVAARPEDALTAAQVADLFRQAGLTTNARELYEKAVQLAPKDPQYREYLGEFYHVQKETEKALKTWAAMAEGADRTAENVSRLAEVYHSFGYLDQAVKEISDACQLAPKEFPLQMRAAEYHLRAAQYDTALNFLQSAEKLAVNEDERDSVIAQRIEVFQAAQRIEAETAALEERIEKDQQATPADWTLLARYYEANRQLADAQQAVDKGLSLDAKSVPTLAAAARIAESSGNYGRAAEFSRSLAELDRRSKGDHLMNVARLEAQLGRSEQALAAASELIVSAPGNTENYEFFAQLCFRLGKASEGLEALRKAVRINPNEPHLIMALGNALAEQLRTDEAIEVYWRAFEKSETVEDKTSLTQKLVPLYEQLNQFEKLIERFERDRQEDEKRRELTICLAQAYQTSGDLGTARTELEQLLSDDTRDTNLLQQLAKLCESSGDLEAAIGYQRQLIALAPGHETEFPLVSMLQARGDRDEAMEILVKLTAREDDPMRLLKSLDSLLTQGAYEAVISVTEPLLSQQRDDWELLYREGTAWAKLEKPAEAISRFQRILALTIPHDTLGLFAADAFRKQQAKTRSENLKGNLTKGPDKRSPLQLLPNASAVQLATGLRNDDDRYFQGRQGPTPVWTPREFAVARMACFGWMMKFEEQAKEAEASAEQPSTVTQTQPTEQPNAAQTTEQNSESGAVSFAAEISARAMTENASREAIYDWLYILHLKGDLDAVLPVSRQLALSGGREEQQFFLTSLQTRHVNAASARSNRGTADIPKTPLSDEDLTLMLKCFDEISKQSDQEASAGAFGGQIVYDSQGNAYIQIGGQYVRIGGGGKGQFVLQITEELRLAGRDAEADEKLNQVISEARTAADLANAASLLIQSEKLESLPDVYRRWQQVALEEVVHAPPTSSSGRNTGARGQQSAFPLQHIQNTLVRWMGRLAPEEEHAQILAILDGALDVGARESRRRIEDRARLARRPSASRSTRSPMGIQWTYGKESQYIQIDFPTPGVYLDMNMVTLLREVHEVFKRNDVLPDLVAHLRKRVAMSTAEDATFNQFCLAAALWWADEPDEAVELITQVNAVQRDDPEARFELADLRTQRGDFDDALEIVDAIIPRDQQSLQRRELLALTLAERLGDQERARAAAERLFGLRLDATTQLSLVGSMRRLGMSDLADAVIARSERQAGNQPAALASLMMLYQSQGKPDKAKQLAHMLLRKTVSPISSASSSIRNSFRGRSEEDGNRTQALQVLQQTGELKTLISQLETQLERSPDTARLYEQLIEFYGVMNQKDKVEPLLTRVVSSRPDAFALRLQLAKHLEQNNRQKEACDHYLILFKQKPNWILEEFYNVQNVFLRAERTGDLAAAVRTLNLKTISQPYYIVNFVEQLMQDEKNTEIAIELMEKMVTQLPGDYYSRSLLGNVRSEKQWQNDRIYQIGKKLIIPTATTVKSNPWSGIDTIYSYSQNGEVNAPLHQLIRGVAGTSKLQDLRQSIEDTLQKTPGWHGGRAILAMVEIQDGKAEAARQRLESLVSDESIAKSIPSATCWLIGQELDKSETTRALAMKLFEKGMVASAQQTQQLQYSPMQKLIAAYSETGRQQDARDLLLKQLRNPSGNQYDVQYSTYVRAENRLFAAKQLLTMSFPGDSFRLYRELLDDEQSLRTAGQWSGNRPDQYVSQAKSGFDQAMSALASGTPEDAVTEVLTVTDPSKKETARLDLMTNAPSAENIGKNGLDCSLVSLLIRMANQDSVKPEIDRRLEGLHQEHPQDISIATARAAFHGALQDPKFAESIETLRALIAAHPLEEIAEGRRPNSRQRKEAFLSIPLWIVAREGLKQPQLHETSEALAARALMAARRQSDVRYSCCILLEWSRLLLESGQTAAAEEKLNELLKLATERPVRKVKEPQKPVSQLAPVNSEFRLAQGWYRDTSDLLQYSSSHARSDAPWDAAIGVSGLLGTSDFRFSSILMTLTLFQDAAAQPVRPQPAADQAENSSADGVAPLTISQFRVAMIVAQTAAENQMMELSHKAVRQALAGGLPVPDPAAPDPRAASRGMRQGVPVVPEEDETSRTEVVTSLLRVIRTWKIHNAAAAEVYTTLKLVVFPPNRAEEIRLLTENTKLREGITESVGGRFVEWAQKASMLQDLKQTIATRRENPSASLSALVLLTKIALAEKDVAAAETTLKELAETLNQAATIAHLQLACHAAIPATEEKSLEEVAYGILSRAVQTPWTKPDPSGNFDASAVTTGRLDGKVHRWLTRRNRLDEVRKSYEQQQLSRQSQYSRYGGDYSLYLQWQDLAKFATEAAQLQIPLISAEYMGKTADFRADNYTQPHLTVPLVAFARHLSTLSPRARFEAWRDWTMPVEGRQTVRMVAQFIRPLDAPEAFLKINPLPGSPGNRRLLCNLTEMLSAAAECGALDELRDAVTKARDEKLPNSEFLYPLFLIETGNTSEGIPVIQQMLDTMEDRNKSKNNRSTKEPRGDYVVYQRCMEFPAFAEFMAKTGRTTFRMMLESLRTGSMLARMDVDFAEVLAARTGGTLMPGNDTGLADWVPTSPATHLSPMNPQWWVAQDNMVYHFAGDDLDVLYFAYPLEGDFEFSVECLQRNWGECDAGYGGVIVQSQLYGSSGTVMSVTGADAVRRPVGLKRTAPAFNDVLIQSTNGKMRYLLNGHLVHEETLSGTCPWITLTAMNSRVSTFRNPRLRGTPVIPREVKLLSSGGMEGWDCSGFGDRRPSPRIMAEKPKDENDSIVYEQRAQPAVFDWNVKEGVLFGEPVADAAADRQSRIRYCRPLRSGEKLQYEFFYQPDTVVAHPTIGRLAFLLEPSGVMTHWLTHPEWDDVLSGIPLNNAIAETVYRRGPSDLPFKPADWNTVEIALNDQTAVISLNGTIVFERDLPANDDTRVGMFRYQQQESRIRNVVLSGDWPETLSDELKNNLLLHQKPLSAGDRNMLAELIPEHVYEVQVPAFLSYVRTLAQEDAFRVLKDWVLPSGAQNPVRLSYRCAPMDVETDSRPSSASDVQSPALELVRLAQELNLTESLLTEVNAIPVTGELARRNQLALQTMLILQGTDVELMKNKTKEVTATLEKGLSPLITPQQRAAEVLVACQAARRAETLPLAAEIVSALQRMERDSGYSSNNDRYSRIVMGVLASLTSDVPAAAEPLSPSQWAEVPWLVPRNRAQGHRTSSWKVSRGQAHHVPGARPAQQFFQSPLQGRFQIRAERSKTPSTARNGTFFVSWGMFAAVPRTDLKAVRMMRSSTSTHDLEKTLEIPGWSESAEIQIDVDGRRITTAVNGVSIHEETLSDTPSPWVMLQTADSGEEAIISNLRIMGNPEIPEQLNLIDMTGWACWRSDFYNESHSTESTDPNVSWKKSGDEIVGQIRTNVSAKPLESLLMYQRPMLEDGEIEFEWFWVPGKQEVHPAVGRSAILIRPDGARLHTLTEAPYETRDLAPGNEVPVPGAAPKIDLRPNDWNQVRIALAGNQLSVFVNGNEVAVHQVSERANERFFGLFRYSDSFQCRVRKLVYRGQWPKSLPDVRDQELAAP